jgi:hypothetical protein
VKDFLDELDQEIDSLQNIKSSDDIIDQHIIMNEGSD